MASKSLCRTCLRNLHQQVRANHHRPIASPAILSQPTKPHVPFQRTFTPQVRHYAATVTGKPPAPGHLELPKDAPIGAKAANADPEEGDKIFKQYVALGATEALFKECALQGDYIVPQAFQRKTEVPKSTTGEDIGEGSGWWYETLGLTPTFNTWAQITMLHMYLLTVRFRYFPEQYNQSWQQLMLDHYFFECEHRMTIFHGMTGRSIRNRNLKDIYNQWRGVIGAYDEGLIKGDAVLGTAVWRNIFKADENVDWRDVAIVTSFMRRGIKALDQAKDKTIVSASVRFGSPGNEKAVVSRPSPGMSRPLTKEDEEGVKEILAEGKGKSST